jgi:hypothetical protein
MFKTKKFQKNNVATLFMLASIPLPLSFAIVAVPLKLFQMGFVFLNPIS